MENGFLLAAVVLSGCAAILSFLPRFHNEKILKLIWCAAAGFVLADLILMLAYLAGGRFDYAYVFNHTDGSLPFMYRISALWSGQEGSFLLWAAISAVVGLFIVKKSKAFGIYSAICFFVFLMCLVSQPFLKQAAMAVDGLGMPEALKDPWMVVHPPLVFVAYSFMSMLAALSADTSKAGIAKRIRRWTVSSWVLLGAGIFTGSIWAYRALGWGGYWAWDPVENAALVPWLILCGNLHAKEKISRSKCVAPFFIACLGTFLVRSGALQSGSAHAYAEGNAVVSLLILFILAGGAALLLVSRLKRAGKENVMPELRYNKNKLLSFTIYMYSLLIALGTAAPFILQAQTPVDYYTVVSVLFVIAYCILLIVWDMETLKRTYMLMLAFSTAAAIAAAAFTGSFDLIMTLLLWVCLMPLPLWASARFKTKSLRYYIIHTGLLLLIIGAIFSLGFSNEAYSQIDVSRLSANVGGNELPTADILSKNQITLSSFFGDTIIRCSEALAVSNSTILVPCETKPLIILFWAGGFTTLLGPFAACAISGIKRRAKRSTE